MDRPSRLPPFDQETADRFLSAGTASSGLPGYLGLRVKSVEPGRLAVEMPVDPKLLTRFGNMHGGVLSALCDHALGLVCYPHMQTGQWAATTEFKLNLLAPVSSGNVVASSNRRHDANHCGCPDRRRKRWPDLWNCAGNGSDYATKSHDVCQLAMTCRRAASACVVIRRRRPTMGGCHRIDRHTLARHAPRWRSNGMRKFTSS